jgi:hypothetical protein
MLDQPFGLRQRMRVCENVYNAVHLWKDADWHTFAKKHPDEWSIVERVLTLRDAMKTAK